MDSAFEFAYEHKIILKTVDYGLLTLLTEIKHYIFAVCGKHWGQRDAKVEYL